jgi:hypothetical protein
VDTICACTPRYNDAPESLVAKLDADGRMIKDGAVTPDGYAINTIDPISEPHDPKVTDDRQFLPLQTMPMIGRRLTDAGISWAWCSGGFADAAAGHPDSTFVYHHQPFAYFAYYAAGTPGACRAPQGRARHAACDPGPNTSRGQLLQADRRGR